MSPKQSTVLQWFNSHEELTLKQAVELIGGNIYANKSFHVSNVLRNMEKHKMLGKPRRGVWVSTGLVKVVDEREVMPSMREWAKKRKLI